MLVTAVGLHIDIPIYLSLIFVAVVLIGSVIASLLWPEEEELEIQVDLPEGFDAPFDQEQSHTAAQPEEKQSGTSGDGSRRGEVALEEEPENLARR